MAFGGVPVQTLVDDYTLLDTGRTLALRIGAPAINAADTGEFTTAAAAAFQVTLNQNWGPGRGNWLAGDENRVDIEVFDANDVAQGGAGQTSLIHLVVGSPRIVAGNFVCTFHNHGAQNSGALRFRFRYNNPIRRGSRRP